MHILERSILQNIPGHYLADSQDIAACLESIGETDLIGAATAIIATIENGEYMNIWYTDSPSPYWIGTVFYRIR